MASKKYNNEYNSDDYESQENESSSEQVTENNINDPENEAILRFRED